MAQVTHLHQRWAEILTPDSKHWKNCWFIVPKEPLKGEIPKKYPRDIRCIWGWLLRVPSQEISNRTHWTDPEKTWVSSQLTERGLYFQYLGFACLRWLEEVKKHSPKWFNGDESRGSKVLLGWQFSSSFGGVIRQVYHVGGFNPSEKYARQIGNLPQGSGWRFIKKYLSWHHLDCC